MYQVCPICKGTGKAGHSWPNSPVCTTCNGWKIISSLTGMPPNYEKRTDMVLKEKEQSI
mgnify:CR=1 FL=1